MEPWGDEEHEAYLRRAFLLSSLVAFDGVRLVGSEASLVATTKESFYELRLAARPEENEENAAEERRHRIELSLSEAGGAQAIEVELSLAEERVALFAVPDPLLLGKRDPRNRSAQDSLFVALSARREDRSRTGRGGERFVEQPDDPPILIAGDAEGGPVRLRAVVRADGSVGGVEVVELPEEEGASRWIAAVSARVREWRYLPARHKGIPVASYVTVELDPRTP
jgi:hypothetical protein